MLLLNNYNAHEFCSKYTHHPAAECMSFVINGFIFRRQVSYSTFFNRLDMAIKNMSRGSTVKISYVSETFAIRMYGVSKSMLFLLLRERETL